MKSIVFSICISFILTNAFAQEPASFTWSDLSDKTLVGTQNPNLVFPTASGFTVYSVEEQGSQYYAPKVIYISKVNASGDRVSNLTFNLPKRSRKDATLLKVIEGNNKLYFFSNVAVKKDGKNVLYAQIYDNTTNTVSETIEMYTLPVEKVNNSGFFKVAISEDRNTLAVMVNKPFVKKTKEAITLLTFDATLNPTSESEHDLSFDSKRANNETLFVANDATINVIKKTNLKKKEPVTSIITLKAGQLTEQQLSSKGFYISDSKVVTIGGEQYVLGFATDNAKPAISVGGAKDNSYFIYNITDETLIKHQEWSKETIKRVLGKGYIDLKVKNILTDKEDIYLIGDCYSKDSEAIEGKNFEYNYTHRFGPGVVIKLNTSGDVLYEIPLSYGEEYLNDMSYLGSFYPFLKDGQLMLLANAKESKLKNKKIVAGYKKINAKVIVLRTVDAQGNIETLPFWNSNTGGAKRLTKFAPTQTLMLSDKVFYMYARGGESHKFGKMVLN